MTDDDLRELSHRLAAMFPPPAVHRGWQVANLEHAFERTRDGTEEVWRADIYGPTDIITDWHRMVGHPRMSTVRISQGVTGTIESPTPDGLVSMCQQVVDALGIADLKEPTLTPTLTPTTR